MKRFIGMLMRVSLVALLALAFTGSFALAHEQRDVGKYHFEVGFNTEPPVEGQMNAVSLRVSAQDAPVEGLEKTLKVEITHVSSATTKEFDLEPVDDDPGHYFAALIPSASGYYRFHFVGAIEGTQVDETFNSVSGGGGFDDVASAADLQFPKAVATPQEAEAVARQAQQDNADTSRMATIGIVLGAIGIVAGAAAFVVALRAGAAKRKAT